jgi:hypothetical protein
MYKILGNFQESGFDRGILAVAFYFEEIVVKLAFSAHIYMPFLPGPH